MAHGSQLAEGARHPLLERPDHRRVVGLNEPRRARERHGVGIEEVGGGHCPLSRYDLRLLPETADMNSSLPPMVLSRNVTVKSSCVLYTNLFA